MMNYRKSIISIILLAIGISNAFAQQLKVEFVTPDIVRVQYSHDGKFESNATGVCVYDRQTVDVKRTDTNEKLTLATGKLKVVVGKRDNAISFYDEDGKELLCQQPGTLKYEPSVQERVIYDEKSAHVEETANGKVTVKDVLRRDTIGLSTRYFVSFHASNEKGIYGLGAHMEDYMNLVGKTVYLTQHNLKASVPVLCSTGGYGLLFDAGCAMKYTSANDAYTMQLEAAKELDYYFIKGKTMGDVIAGYHYLTGKPSLMPRYVFGYTQSKERYVSSDDIIKTLREYRKRHVPIDMIVQDWNYWPQGWGYMKMNPKYYPDPKALADSVHAMNAKLMVSIWPNPQWCPEAEDFKQRGMMLEHDIYDAFNPEARKHYWKYANDEFFSRGFDAWWCDSSEPLDGDWNKIPGPTNGKPYGWDSQEQRWNLNKDVLSEALGVERSSLFSLYHSMGIYENQRQTTTDKRVVNLTRSTYAGQQRYGTIVWNGDTHASWKSFKQQIPSGLNYMATGNPYWTVDVGSFFTRNDGRRWFYKGEFQNGVKDDAYKDYYVRMFQWATFLPMLRSHGSDTPREIWQFENSKEKGNAYYDAILKMINLRYSLIPYIYSMAAKQTFDSYTMARMLAFDYPKDEKVLDIKDEYMFGDFLVCPVTEANATSRKVYLPTGSTWIDYWTGKRYSGGESIEASCDIATLPLYVRAGSIMPTTEVAEYSDAQKGKPVTINVYEGKDADFTLYEDEGDNYNYEKGQYSTIPLSWDDAKKVLTIGERKGSYEGMLQKRTFIVTVAGGKTKQVKYNGKRINLRMR
ncbi:MAG: glycoside hydrolase family 31 protein [Prevotella sp.]|nr:glycoside hydrolase family 31 protein [Candidatus Prevotella equi]